MSIITSTETHFNTLTQASGFANRIRRVAHKKGKGFDYYLSFEAFNGEKDANGHSARVNNRFFELKIMEREAHLFANLVELDKPVVIGEFVISDLDVHLNKDGQSYSFVIKSDEGDVRKFVMKGRIVKVLSLNVNGVHVVSKTDSSVSEDESAAA